MPLAKYPRGTHVIVDYGVEIDDDCYVIEYRERMGFDEVYVNASNNWTAGISWRERIWVQAKTIEPICKRCGQTLGKHVNNKCLFDSTTFTLDVDPRYA